MSDAVEANNSVQFLHDGGMDFAVRCVLTGVRYGMAEVGEVLQAVDSVTDGSPDSWRDTWLSLAERLEVVADHAAHEGHAYSAWGAYLRASNYAFAGNWYAPATTSPAAAPAGWQLHRSLWDRSVDHWPSAASRIEIPFGDASLPGYFFHGTEPDSVDRPLVIIVNGIETPMSDTTMTGLVDGLHRGYRVLCFDGPGQGAALYERGMALNADWRAVISAVLTRGINQPGVDRRRVCVQGINHGGLFSLIGAAGEERIAALVLDPGVTSLIGDVIGGLPEDLQDLYRTEPSAFDAALADTTDPDVVFWMAKALDPFPGMAPSAAMAGLATLDVEQATLSEVSASVYIAAAEEAESFAGQGPVVAERLRADGADVRVDPFTVAEGAALDCEILAPQVRNQRVYDWLDHQLR